MHNIDRTVGEANYEYNNESYEMNPESYEYQGEYGNQEMEGEDEFLNELNGRPGEPGGMSGEYQGEYQGEAGYGSNELNQETFEMELATELLGVSNEAELEQFLGKLISRAAGAVKSFANSSAGQALGGILKSAAKKALPIAGGALGSVFGGPVGGMIGNKLGSFASNLFEMELEGLSNEDKEFELSKAYVRFANNAVRQAARNPKFRAYPRQVARNAVVASAKRFAPGLLRRRPVYGRSNSRPSTSNYNMNNNYNGSGSSDNSDYDNSASGEQASGTWYKEGNQIILNL